MNSDLYCAFLYFLFKRWLIATYVIIFPALSGKKKMYNANVYSSLDGTFSFLTFNLFPSKIFQHSYQLLTIILKNFSVKRQFSHSCIREEIQFFYFEIRSNLSFFLPASNVKLPGFCKPKQNVVHTPFRAVLTRVGCTLRRKRRSTTGHPPLRIFLERFADQPPWTASVGGTKRRGTEPALYH